jgi:hypothetical protein
MLKHLQSWLVVTGLSAVAIGLLAALGLGVYLVTRVVYFGLGLMNITFK